MHARRYDIFCRVIDHYGDAGVCWRLARQLVREHDMAVTLWIDAPAALARLAPGVDLRRDDQAADGVRVRTLSGDADAIALPDVTVEGFGCGLPDRYVEAMAQAPRPPVWINLEYLSAEPWVDGAHGLPSPQPRLPLTRHFFFPGFTPATGGLLREEGLLEARDAATADPAARRETWRALGVAPPDPEAFALSLFCYPNRALPALLERWADGEEKVSAYVPEGVALGTPDPWGAVPGIGRAATRGALALTTIPFVAQDAYDRLLWQCAVNFVRGEDSFVRAQWAARPFVWHLYPQADEARRVKRDEFLHRFQNGLDAGAARATARFWRAWNDGDGDAAAAAWTPFRAALPALAAHARAWARRLAALPDLPSALVEFADDRL
jgi:uncharacterized repeat protein (TIGR03837 family)